MMPLEKSDVYVNVNKARFNFSVSISQIKKQRQSYVDVDHVIGSMT